MVIFDASAAQSIVSRQIMRVGEDAYGRLVEATRTRTYDGKVVWEIKIHAANQRDDTQTISGLTDENVACLKSLFR